MNTAVLLTGGNVGNREKYLAEAQERIGGSCGNLVAFSPIYETDAWGKQDQNSFLNQALVLQTGLSPAQLLKAILSIETELGRIRTEKYGPRTIDIDIIFYNDAVIAMEGLIIPHPEVANRRFALQCLVGVVPRYIHPVFKKTVEKLLADCQDPLQARVYIRE